jgi:3-oxoacyl-[acyl-carrier protein] reductase
MAADRPRHVFITGGRRGLGEALARHYVSRGDLVTTCSRSEMPLLDPERHLHYVADVSDAAALERALERVRDDRGYLDALVNNAGIASMNAVALTPTETVQRLMRTNVEAVMVATRAAFRLLRHSSAGRVVNMSTVAVPLRLEGEAVYAASKAAVETFTRVAAKEYGPFGITCNAVGPSPVATDLTARVPAEKMDRLIREQAIRRWATPEDVINVVDFFLSPASQMVTGQVVYLGGAG